MISSEINEYSIMGMMAKAMQMQPRLWKLGFPFKVKDKMWEQEERTHAENETVSPYIIVHVCVCVCV